MIRKLMRRILPGPALSVALSVRDVYAFRRTPAAVISGMPLPDAGEICFAELFGDDLAGEWAADRRAIGEVFEYAEKGWAVTPVDRRAIWYLVRRLRPRSVLEVGTHIGGSTAHIAMALKGGGTAATPGRLVTVDAVDVNDATAQRWRRFGSAMSPREMLERLGCAGRVEFVVSRSLDYLAGRADAEFDFVFLDGSHQPHIVYQEIAMALKALRPGGYLLMHDYFPGLKPLRGHSEVIAGPYRAVARLRREGNGVAALPLGALPWRDGAGADTTSLAVLARDGAAGAAPGAEAGRRF